MTKLKKTLAHIMCLVLSVIVLSGCSITELIASFFDNKDPVQLAAPTLTLDIENESLGWSAVDNATTYYICANNTNLYYRVDDTRQPSYTVAISDVTDVSGEYHFYVIASSTDTRFSDSPKSNVVTYTYVKLNRLDTPNITIDKDTKTLSWDAVENATAYKIYKDGAFLIEVTNTVLSYDFSSHITNYGVYRFQVIAKGDGTTYKESRLSRAKRYFYSDVEIEEIDKTDVVMNDSSYNISATFSNGILTSEKESGKDYVVVAYANEIDYVYTAFNENTFDIQDIVLEDGIYAIRVAIENDGKLYADDDIFYYNTAPVNDYTANQKIYVFDGKINDYYIENYDELCNIVYYQFILRNEDYTIRLSDEYIDEIKADSRFSHKSQLYDKVNVLLEYAFNSFMETCYYNYGNGHSYANKVQGSQTDYRILLDFYDVLECDTTIEPITVYEQKDYIPYYENYVGTPRGDYFASDNRFITTYVTTTEQLFWAVTYGYTPLFTSNTCMAKVVYDKAKEVLKDIIYVEMTDYEKALAIFDWIALNTSYDHSDYNCYGMSGFDANKDGYYYTDLPGFYLEGVFVTGNSVCDGFAKAYALLCNMEDIDCIRIVGTVNGGGHAWNKVKLGDKWYVVDITWTETTMGEEELLFHSYFLVSDSFISATHKDYSQRTSYEEYPALNMYNHFANYNFIYKGTMYDYVITSDSEFDALFHYVLDNDIDSLEFVVDCTTYISTGTFDEKLSSVFTIMRKEKFASQYLNLVRWNSQRLITYADGKQGFLFNADVTLLIDSVTEDLLEGTKNEVQNLISYTATNNLTCENTLYIKKELFEEFVASGKTLEESFAEFIDEYNVLDLDFNYTVTALSQELVIYGTSEENGQTVNNYGYMFNLVINPQT